MLQIYFTQGEGNETPEMKLKSENWDQVIFDILKLPIAPPPC